MARPRARDRGHTGFAYGWFTPRGWGILATGVLVLLGAQVLGRRDLLIGGTFLIALPLMAVASLQFSKPAFDVFREFAPTSVPTDTTSTVSLTVAATRPQAGRVSMTEGLPARFGTAPTFGFPSSAAPSAMLSRYQYHLQSTQRGQFQVGPVQAEFTDPFGLMRRKHQLHGTDLLTVTPAAVELPRIPLTGTRGIDGVTSTRQRANPSDDDVMTREYRHGDPLRRVHWPATARAGEMMVRQEESVTTPEATLVIDARIPAFLRTTTAAAPTSGPHPELVSSENFEFSVVAAMSIAQHLIGRNFSLRILDPLGAPGFRTSASAPLPEQSYYAGSSGLANIAESLAALELTAPEGPGPGEATRLNPAGLGLLKEGSLKQNSLHRRSSLSGSQNQGTPSSLPTTDASAYGAALDNELAAHHGRGPLVALVGALTDAEATQLAHLAQHGSAALVLLVTDSPRNAGNTLAILRRGGWQALAVDHRTDVAAAWSYFAESVPLPSSLGSAHS